MRCMNCNIALQRLQRHDVTLLSPSLQTRLSQWLATPLPTNGYICQPCLTLNSEEAVNMRLLGHTMVCHGCGLSVRGIRHYTINADSPVLPVILSWNNFRKAERGYDNVTSDSSASVSKTQVKTRSHYSKYDDSDSTMSEYSDAEDTTENQDEEIESIKWQKYSVTCPAVARDGQNQTMLADEERQSTNDSEYVCSACQCCISGVRYKCVQCSDYDVCAACEARGVHALHYALRVPEHSAQDEVIRVIEAIRNCLNEDPASKIMQLVKEEVKGELQIKEELLDVEECDPLSALEEQQVLRGSERDNTDIDKRYIHTRQQDVTAPTLHTSPSLHTVPTQHTTPIPQHTAATQHTTPIPHHLPIQHTAAIQHTIPTEFTIPSIYTLPIQYTTPTEQAQTAALDNVQITVKQENFADTQHTSAASPYYAHNITASCTSQIERCSNETRNPTLSKDLTNSSMFTSTYKQLKRTANVESSDQKLLIGKRRSMPSYETAPSLTQY